MLAVKALGQAGGVRVHIRLAVEVGVGLPIRVATAPLEHGQGVGDDDVLLHLGPAHAQAGVTALAPADDF